MARIMIVGFGNEGAEIQASLAANFGPVARFEGMEDLPEHETEFEVAVLNGDGVSEEAIRYWSTSGRYSILLCRELSVEAVLEMMRAGAREILEKPVDMGTLEAILAELLEHRQPTISGLARRIDAFVRRHAAHEAFCLLDVGRPLQHQSRLRL